MYLKIAKNVLVKNQVISYNKSDMNLIQKFYKGEIIMKKLLSTLLVVVFLLSSLGLTAFAADDYTVQYLGDGFTRLTLTDTAFVAGTARTFTVSIPEDGDYAVFISNPNTTQAAITATFTKGDEAVTVASGTTTSAFSYVRLGIANASAVSSVSLTQGQWTLSVASGTDITIPYIDIRSTIVSVNGSKTAIYPMDVNSVTPSIGATTYIDKYINEPAGSKYTKAPSEYTYYGDQTSSSLSVTRSAPGVIFVGTGKTVTHKINVETAGEYKIIAYGKLRTLKAVTEDYTPTISMTVGSNSPVSGSHTFAAGTVVDAWSSYISLESTVELEEGEYSIVIQNSNTLASWYYNYITVEGVGIEVPEEPDTGEDEEEVGPYTLVSNNVASYTAAALEAYRTDAYANYTNTVVTSYYGSGHDYSKPVTLKWNAVDGAESYDLYVSTSADYTGSTTRVIEGIEATTYDVINLYTGATYYWKAVSGDTVAKSGTFQTVSTPRFLTVEGVNNVRDIGGWNGLNQGMAYRGTELNLVGNNGYALTEEGKRVMHDDLGIKTDLDLRATGITESPIGSDVNFVVVFISNYTAAFTETDKYAKIIATFADIDNYPIYFHCMGGADRTGTVGAIVEALAGADEAELSIDYELTGFSKVGARPRNSTVYNYKGLIAGLKAYEGATLQEKTENYAIKTLGLTRKQVSNIQSLMGGNKVVFADTDPVEVKAGATITLENLGSNTVTSVSFKGESIPYTMNGNVITLDLETLGEGAITFADGNVMKFEANSILDISFDDIANDQASGFVTKNLTLPEGYTWTSSNPAVVSTTGVVTRPEFKDVMVELVASTEKGSKSIMFTVKAKTTNSHFQSTFAYPSLVGNTSQTAVLGTTAGGSLINGWSVETANVTSSSIDENGALSIELNAQSGSLIPKVYFGFDEPVKEKFLLEFDMGNYVGSGTKRTIFMYVRVKDANGAEKDICLTQYSQGDDCLRYAPQLKTYKTLNNLGGTHISGINDTVTTYRMEFDPVKMTVRYARTVNSNWQNLCTKYGDILNSDTSGDENPYIADSADTIADANYEVLGFYFESNAVYNTTTLTLDNVTAYTQKDCAVADMSVNISGNVADVNVELTAAYTGVMIIALYDENAALTGVKLVEMSSSKTASETISFKNIPVKANVFFVENMASITPLKVNVPLANTALEWK